MPRRPVWPAAVLALCIVASAGAYSLYEPARVVARPDYTLGVVFLERWRGDYYLGVDRVLTIEEYLQYQLTNSISESWQKKAKDQAQQRDFAADATGLIPDIDLPRLPLFGEGSKIDISGRDRITLGGRQTFVRRPGIRDTTPTFPELKMNQQLSVALNGTIGDRMKVNIDFDDERLEGKNKVLLAYTGTEDEVIQSLELGDTRLYVPGSAYTGDLPAHRGLFGASARGKLAGVDVYAIASREESQNQTQTFTGQRRVSIDTIYDIEYITRRFYRVPVAGAVRTLQVWVDDRNPGNNQGLTSAIATVRPDRPELPAESLTWSYDRAPGVFELKSLGKDYFLRPGNIIEFATALSGQDVVGLVVYTDAESLGGGRYPGPSDSLVLAMLKPQVPDTLSETWDYELRNYYQLPQTEVTLNSLRIFRDNPQGQDVEVETEGASKDGKFVVFLGLDPNNDGRLEYPQFEKKTGLVVFPGDHPFDSTALSVRDGVIYRRDPYALLPNEGRKYYMVAEYSSATESYYLGQPDITDGSEKVIVNGIQWVKDDGYSIDYRSGVLKFLKPLPADADIRVTFEYQPLFSLSQKSLMGTRAEYAMSQQGKVGASVFYRSEGIPEDKPALGSEPFRRMIAEADASYAVSSSAVTSFLDRLPLVRAQAPTTLGASAEGAVSLPDPNTRDAAYLDDFEGTTVTRDVSITAILWSWASVPVGRDTADFARTPLAWVNPTDTANKVRNRDVFGVTGDQTDDQFHDLLRVGFVPGDGGTSSWAGMMTSPSQQLGMNLKDFEALKLVVRSRHGRGRLHVSVGLSIDEDAPRRTRSGAIAGYDGLLNTEDVDGNGQLNEGSEDAGLDGVFGKDDSAVVGDDGNDDYNVRTNPLGTEMNGRLDGEDVDRSGFSRYNHYYECQLELGDERFFSPLLNGWQLVRVPLMDSTAFVRYGTPKWEDVRLVRVWFDGFDAADTIDFYSIEFTGSRWSNPVLRRLGDHRTPPDTAEAVWVTQVSKKTDLKYGAPFKLKEDIQGNVEQEASLLLGYRNLGGESRAIIAKSSADREDYRDYENLRIYVHDDSNGLSFVLRLGSDSLNYYEYKAPIASGPVAREQADVRWREFEIPLDSLPYLKLERDSLPGRPNAWQKGQYALKGVPNLADIRYTALGIENPARRKISGGVWFDDLRLTAPRKEPGYGLQSRANFALSDLFSAGLAFNYSDPNFRRFSEGRGVKTGGFGTGLSFNARANLDRFLPASWGLSAPVSYSTSRQQESPKFHPAYPDLRMSRQMAAEKGYVSSGASEDWAVDNLRKARSTNKIMNYTLEAMGASWRTHRGQSSSALDSSFNRSTTFQWSYAVSPDLKVKLGRENELSLFPQSVRLGLADARRLDYRRTKPHPDSAWLASPDSLGGHGLSTDFGVEYSPVEDLSFDYSFGTERDLGRLVANEPFWGVKGLKLGSEAAQEHNFTAGYDIEVGDILSPSIDFNGDYSDDRPKEGPSYAAYRNLTNSGEVEFSLGLDLPEVFSKFEAKPPRAAPPPKAAKPDTTRPAKPDTTKPDSAGAKPPEKPKPARPRFNLGVLSQVFDAIDASYSTSWNSDIIAAGRRGAAPWYYKLGLWDSYDTIPVDTSRQDTAAFRSSTREHQQTLRFSTGARIRELSGQISYDWSEGRNFSSVLSNVVLDRSTTFPDLSLTLGKVHNLFKKYATDSKLSSGFRRRNDLGGQLVPVWDSIASDTTLQLSTIGQTRGQNNELAPLLSWQTTWKRRITTTLTANYNWSTTKSYVTPTDSAWSQTDSRDPSLNLSVGYTFSAPQGLRLPFLRKLKFTSDLSLTGSLRMAQTHRWSSLYEAYVQKGDSTVLQRDNSFGTDLAASYRFSRSIEAGLNTGYTNSKNQSGVSTGSVNLDFWVLFRF